MNVVPTKATVGIARRMVAETAGADVAACAGKWELFDSTDRADHREAVKLCRDCPLMLNRECVTRLRTAQQAERWSGPQGTWAGMLLISSGPATDRSRNRDSDRIADEEATYTDDECRLAKAMAAQGVSTEWVRAGCRTYERRRKRSMRRALADNEPLAALMVGVA